ncbi:MAG: hypothetical protein NTZ18_03825 [Candidatus Komeilibacteria bacterium]|nr:hypothetical protein [Candidatus Komeilibacteria bacterium]
MTKKIKIIQTVHDADCPKCKFPETIHIRDAKTMKILGEKCSKKGCDYFVLAWIRRMLRDVEDLESYSHFRADPNCFKD